MLQHIKVYCRESSIHGFPYFVKDIHWIEKIFWIVSLIISCICCGALIFKIGLKVQEDAIVTYTSDIAIKITETPFIAVTFCPDILTHNEAFDYNQLVNALKAGEIMIENVTQTELKFLQAVALVVDDDFLSSFNVSIDANDVTSYIKNLTWDWSYNPWKLYQDVNFDDYYGVEFAEIIGPYGFCYTFNILDADELYNLQNTPNSFNYSRPIKIMEQIRKYRRRPKDPRKYNITYPTTVGSFKSGFMSKLQMLTRRGMVSDLDKNHHKSQINHGLRYLFHSPYDMFSKASRSYQSMPMFTVLLFVDPQVMEIDEALKIYEPERRGCFLEDEKQLRFFKYYSKSNCQMECLSNQTLKLCGCVQFYMIREVSTRVCGVQDMRCYQKVEAEMSNQDACQCYPRCDEISYKVEQKRMDFLIYHNHGDFEVTGFSFASEILVYFKSAEFFPIILQQQFTLLDFVAYTGGALGLFLGFSVLSFFEIIYYFSARFVLSLKMNRKVENISGQPNVKKSSIARFLFDFFDNSSIHGMNQVVMKKRFSIERCFWFLAVLLSLVYCGFATNDIYLKYKNAPIVFTYDNSLKASEKLPFPAITFNSETFLRIKYKKSLQIFYYYLPSAEWLINLYKEIGQYEQFFLQTLMCNEELIITRIDWSKTNDSLESIIKTLKNFSAIHWFRNQTATWNTFYRPEFAEILTRRGYGFVFNQLPPSKLFTDKISADFTNPQQVTPKLPTSIEMTTSSANYPLYATVSDGNGLKLLLNSNQNIKRYDLCYSWAFIVHSPYELSSSYEDNERCDFHYGVDLEVQITPEIIYTDKDLEHRYTPTERGCFFDGEKTLEFFKVYTLRNCELECLAELYLNMKETHCVPFYLPRNDSVQKCDHKQERFVQFFKYNLFQDLFGELTDCGCLERCDSIKYNVEVLEKKRSDYNNTLDKNMDPTNVSISFKFTDSEITPMRRCQPLTFLEFLAQSGGLMGLFAGISALSVIETFYFFILRPFTNLMSQVSLRFKKKN